MPATKPSSVAVPAFKGWIPLTDEESNEQAAKVDDFQTFTPRASKRASKLRPNGDTDPAVSMPASPTPKGRRRRDAPAATVPKVIKRTGPPEKSSKTHGAGRKGRGSTGSVSASNGDGKSSGAISRTARFRPSSIQPLVAPILTENETNSLSVPNEHYASKSIEDNGVTVTTEPVSDGSLNIRIMLGQRKAGNLRFNNLNIYLGEGIPLNRE